MTLLDIPAHDAFKVKIEHHSISRFRSLHKIPDLTKAFF
jgi:hypothetical protein